MADLKGCTVGSGYRICQARTRLPPIAPESGPSRRMSAEPMAEAIGSQVDYDTRHKQGPYLTDVLIASIILAGHLEDPAPRVVAMGDAFAFQSIRLTQADCGTVLTHAQYQLGSLYEALGC
jgi:hypothetical protein